jgi:AbrB family looped-hinge helix DNA binding protein
VPVGDVNHAVCFLEKQVQELKLLEILVRGDRRRTGIATVSDKPEVVTSRTVRDLREPQPEGALWECGDALRTLLERGADNALDLAQMVVVARPAGRNSDLVDRQGRVVRKPLGIRRPVVDTSSDHGLEQLVAEQRTSLARHQQRSGNRRSKTPMRVTERGQITIPKRLRDELGIGAGSEVEFARSDDAIVIRKVRTGKTRGQHVAERLRRRGDVALTTDEIMALTRGG